jgi:type I restriction enzyme S subunit
MSKWEKVRLGDLTKIKTGKLDANASSNDGEYPFFTCSKEPLKISSYSYDCECVLVAGNGDLNVKYYNGKFDAYQRTYIIESIDKNKLFVPYLYLYLSDYVDTLRGLSIGGVIKYIKLGNLTDAAIPIPPLNTQKQIVAILDKANLLIESRKQQLAQLDLLVKSRFVEMFGDEDEFNKWDCTTIENVARITVGVVIRPAQYYSKKTNGIRAFRSLNIGEMYVRDGNWVFFTPEGHRSNTKSELKTGDVLIVRSGYPGTSCVVTEKYAGCNAIDIIIATPHMDKINPLYLCAFTNFPHGKNQIIGKTGGAAQQHFNIGAYKEMVIPIPPLPLQNAFAAFVEQADKSKFEIQKGLKQMEIQYNALMQQYFG